MHVSASFFAPVNAVYVAACGDWGQGRNCFGQGVSGSLGVLFIIFFFLLPRSPAGECEKPLAFVLMCPDKQNLKQVLLASKYYFDFLRLVMLHVMLGDYGTNGACQARKWYLWQGQERCIFCSSTVAQLKLTASRSVKAIIWLHQFLKQHCCFTRFFLKRHNGFWFCFLNLRPNCCYLNGS